MNIFVTNPDPVVSAKALPDKHVVKMPLETCQMLSIVFSHWYYNWGDDLVKKKDGTAYKTSKGAFRNHPCTQWAADSIYNTAWLIQHGCALSDEYKHDTSIDTLTAYKNYIRSKPWAASNYLRDEARKPDWI